jgi:hypothetical protein
MLGEMISTNYRQSADNHPTRVPLTRVFFPFLIALFFPALGTWSAETATKTEIIRDAMKHVPTIAELVGGWELVSMEQIDSKERRIQQDISSTTSVPDMGQLQVLPDGRIFIVISRHDRGDPSRQSTAAGDAAFLGIVGNYTYRDGLLIYTPIAASDPARQNIPFRRHAELEGNLLTLRTEDGLEHQGWLIRWRRLSEKQRQK